MVLNMSILQPMALHAKVGISLFHLIVLIEIIKFSVTLLDGVPSLGATLIAHVTETMLNHQHSLAPTQTCGIAMVTVIRKMHSQLLCLEAVLVVV